MNKLIIAIIIMNVSFWKGLFKDGYKNKWYESVKRHFW